VFTASIIKASLRNTGCLVFFLTRRIQQVDPAAKTFLASALKCTSSGVAVPRSRSGTRKSTFKMTDWLTLWRQNPKVHHRIHNSPPPVPILSQMNPRHTPRTILSTVHFDRILASTPWSSKRTFSFGLPHQNPVHVLPLSHACHMPCPRHYPRLDLPNNIWWRVQIMKLPTVQLSPVSHHLNLQNISH
jgi:hypothetical protein